MPRALPRNLIVIDHPLIQRDLTILRDRTTDNMMFRSTLRRIASVMAFVVTHDLRLRRRGVRTPLEHTTGFRLAERVVLVPVLRAGLGMIEGFLDYLPEARVGHVGLYRNEETLLPVEYYARFPRTLRSSIVMLLDPMLATGGSAVAAVDFLKKKGARRIKFVSLLASPQGARHFIERHPDVQVYTTIVDRTLNEHGYILPGLGDAGDRIFGTD